MAHMENGADNIQVGRTSVIQGRVVKLVGHFAPLKRFGSNTGIATYLQKHYNNSFQIDTLSSFLTLTIGIYVWFLLVYMCELINSFANDRV